ncbi:MAG: N-acetylmuramoyl-L-alanine amidase [Bacilli bacterium]|nr:N-acetylmuramoyl-L-alanine amidase [Bacilli bacterium]
MEKAINFIKSVINKEIIEKRIRVYGWQKEYEHLLISSVSKFLFEDFFIIDNLTPLTNENRPGNIKPKFYITVHDTGDSDITHTALFWSNTVKNEYWEQGKYACSYQYVVGNDGTYQQIPDNEVAWHAGDTTKFDYALYDSNVMGSNPNPIITISSDGYFEIDGKKSQILAPRVKKEKDGKVIIDRIPTTSDINDQGILCKLIDGKYYLGEVYFNETYMLIANRGGNNNSIGIESCINENTDIYYTWQKTAKLVANLLYKHNLTFDDVKQHHYYSGKNCPQTIRMNGFWPHFMELVKAEYQAIELLKEGYKFRLINRNNNILETGRVIENKDIVFSVEIIKDNKKIILDFNL